MRAKFLLLFEQPSYREGLRWVQDLLSELAVAFSHSFLMREDSLESRQQELPLLAQEHEVILLAGSTPAAEACADALDCHSGFTSFSVGEATLELSRLKDGHMPVADLFWPLKEDQTSSNRLAVAVSSHAKKTGRPVILCQEEDGGGWGEAFNKAAMYAALPAPIPMTFEEALEAVLFQQDSPGIVVASAQQAALLRSVLSFLSGSENLRYTAYLAEKLRLYQVTPAPGEKGLPLFSLLYAAADALRNMLQLDREADCLKTAIDNVLQTGWRTPEFGLLPKTISHDEAVRLMVEQVQLAGELMERFQ